MAHPTSCRAKTWEGAALLIVEKMQKFRAILGIGIGIGPGENQDDQELCRYRVVSA